MPVFTVGDFKKVLRVYLVILEEMVRGPLSMTHVSDPASEDTTREAAEESLRWLHVLDAAITPARLRSAIERLRPSEQDVQAAIRFLACKSPLEDEDCERLEFLSAFVFRVRGGWEQPDSQTTMAKEIQEWLQDSWLEASPSVVDQLRQLEGVCQGVLRCTSFAELIPSRLIERGRTLKKACGSEIVLPAVLAAFTHYNLWVGRHFEILMDRAAEAENFPEEAAGKDYRKAGEAFWNWMGAKADAVLLRSAVSAPLPAAGLAAPPTDHKEHERLFAKVSLLQGDPQVEERNFQATVSQVVHTAREAREPMQRLRMTNSTLTVSPWEFQSLVRDYPESESSFRADANRVLRRTVGLLAAMCEEFTLFEVRRSSEYLWKKHLSSLAYLAGIACGQLVSMQDLTLQATTRGLRMKAEQLTETVAKLESRLGEIAGLCEENKAHAVAPKV